MMMLKRGPKHALKAWSLFSLVALRYPTFGNVVVVVQSVSLISRTALKNLASVL